ncbi:hypothetical protein MWQ79_000216 [Staphylococcus pseudintermedius]|uniref:hypothetical protein n=1 Tax=Staphylococcus pseudintermedius TaxID=283734 RepID=UPI0019352F19|nr:hypothetical protein [Staphylococcus pseudintermedius]EJA1938767.1 hypothetical protein [Staphylococcus pseudintermedius]QQJ82600.1 hypothetical protein JGZ40_08000 [Staphylococcus pseudintermedius]
MTENKMTFEQIKKHAKKVTKNTKNQILNYMYLNDNHVDFSDGHRLVRIKHQHEYNNMLINPKNESDKNRSEYPYNFPNFENVIPKDKDAKNVIIFNSEEINVILNVLKLFKNLKVNLVKFELNENDNYLLTAFNSENEEAQRLELSYTFSNKKIDSDNVKKIVLNTEYLLNAFEFLKDFNKVNNEDSYFLNLYGRIQPIKINDKNKTFIYVICPIR